MEKNERNQFIQMTTFSKKKIFFKLEIYFLLLLEQISPSS